MVKQQLLSLLKQQVMFIHLFLERVIEGNKSIVDDPVSVNTDPEGASWFFKLKVKDKSELDSLMSQADYEKFVAENPS